MFPFEPQLLPKLSTRKAFIAIDFQLDFIPLEDGISLDKQSYKPKLPAIGLSDSSSFIDKILDLADRARTSGNVVCWVRSTYEGPRQEELELPKPSGANIYPSLETSPMTGPISINSPDSDGTILKESGSHETQWVGPDTDPYPDAFLSPGPCHRQLCVQPSTLGIALHPRIQETLQKFPRDIVVTKSAYSAFKCKTFLQRLRTNFVTELVICGSLMNSSVYATVIEAAGHGYSITVVDDCCGYTDGSRRDDAIKDIIDITGCDVKGYEDATMIFGPPQDALSNFKIQTLKAKEIPLGTTATFDNEPNSDLPFHLALHVQQVKSSPSVISDGCLHEAPSAMFSQAIVSDESKDMPRRGLSASEDFDKRATGFLSPNDTPTADDSDRLRDSADVEADAFELVEQSIISDLLSISLNEEIDGLVTTDELQSNFKQNIVHSPLPHHGDKTVSCCSASDLSQIGPRSYNLSSPTEMCNGFPRPDSSETIKTPHIGIKLSHISQDEPSGSRPLDLTEERTDSRLYIPMISRSMDAAICEGDTVIIPSVLPCHLASTAYDQLLDEVIWGRMAHHGGQVPRLIAAQADINSIEGYFPVYRQPADALPMPMPYSKTVLAIKHEVEKWIHHPVNHVLIQHYRDGQDYITEHSDKTLDIAKNSFICNLSLGAERVMVFRTKKDRSSSTLTSGEAVSESRKVVRVKLPHNSLCKMGLLTNMKWLHGIRAEKQPGTRQSSSHTVMSGGRISLTFRHINTFMSVDGALIWGQGATSKSQDDAKKRGSGSDSDVFRMLRAFSAENHCSDFHWDQHYCEGFDILPTRVLPKLYLGADPIANIRVAVMLTECGIDYAIENPDQTIRHRTYLLSRRGSSTCCIKYREADASETSVEGDIAILWYLDSHYLKTSRDRQPSVHARQLKFVNDSVTFLQKCCRFDSIDSLDSSGLEAARSWFAYLESIVPDAGFLVGGDSLSIADVAIWPIIHLINVLDTSNTLLHFQNVRKYYIALQKYITIPIDVYPGIRHEG
jgi:nicotinamidase-related amidase